MELYQAEMSYFLICLLNYEQIGMEANKDTITVKANIPLMNAEFTLPDAAELSTFNILIIPNYNNFKDGIGTELKTPSELMLYL
ncbi:hypothetical protein [Clostridium sp.]|jgi:hypothetical protein|uniref:hypothetical protein n=1 Tax=Clostridium sp. TaxID=1506 RepID=UPI00257F68E5|nr:hypothetical protein [Clostridium sp.]